MLRIAICDDDLFDLNQIKSLTISLLNSLLIDYELETFSNGNDLLKTKISFDLFLLDIKMDHISGIDVAREIRHHSKDVKIIFITNYQEYYKAGYTVNANRFLTKPLNPDEFNYEITTVLKQIITDTKYILDKRIGSNKIMIKDIIYIEFNNRKTIIHNMHDDIATIITLNEWIALLENYYFSRIHKGFIINLKYVKQVNANSLLLKNNIELPLGRKYKEKFKNNYLIYMGENI